jgi:hypothetical protein
MILLMLPHFGGSYLMDLTMACFSSTSYDFHSDVEIQLLLV